MYLWPWVSLNFADEFNLASIWCRYRVHAVDDLRSKRGIPLFGLCKFGFKNENVIVCPSELIVPRAKPTKKLKNDLEKSSAYQPRANMQRYEIIFVH
jgi:hypothetical protein